MTNREPYRELIDIIHDGGYHRKNTTFKETIKKALVEYFYNTNVYACDLTRVNEAMETGNINLLDFDEFSEEVMVL